MRPGSRIRLKGAMALLGDELIEPGAVPSEPQQRPASASRVAYHSGKIVGPTWNPALDRNAGCADLHILAKNSAEVTW
jgi:hypothetical protein